MPLIIKTTGFQDYLDKNGGAYLKALIMGDHGVGKTPSACSWPKPILADCENGRLSVASMGVPYADIRTSADMEALLDMMRRECLKPADKRQYETLIIDTFDSYQRKLIQERLKNERKESLSGWADWGWLDGKMVALTEAILNLPMNVVVNLHTKDVSEEDGDESRLVQKARLKGDVKDSIFQDFDLIGHMEQSYVADPEKKGERKRVRQIRWHSEPKYPALRDRSNRLPRFTEVTFTADDYWQIFNAITGGLDDLPAVTEVETLPTEGDDDTTPPADEKGGPVANPSTPPAKKAAAKKAPAKKAAARKPEPEPTPEPEPEPEPEPAAETDVQNDDPWQPEVKADDAVEQAEALVESELGGQAVEEPEPEPAAEPAPAAPEPKPAAPEPKAAKACGEQPASMVGKYDAVDGCGVELSAENAGKAQIAMMKFRTYLCNDCFARKQAS